MKKFKFKKKYGQNFLNDNNVLEKIVNNLEVTNKDLIIEIGPGTGNLTKKLLKFNSKILAYEIDIDTKEYLNNIKYSELTVLYSDFLKRNIKRDIKNIKYENLYIIGNLPYYITTPIIDKIIQEDLKAKELIFMVQKEVADRLSATPGKKEYSYITVKLKYYYNIIKLFDVSKKSFYPIPKVDSSILKLTPHNQYLFEKEEKFLKVISSSFKYKRKTLLNNLKDYDREIVKKILKKYNYTEFVRAEELPIEIFLEISNAL
ncbi:MAG: 16S rRNA (adenine(1518)-N(6)/adenine(1519)-N(6))-dimethyltransferase RsmA [Bacilli bacterium]|nr:16S rRNA (adenine(1518)-N(6)/adenine(1519)-N(6))-dimethyltransferase RsmA [Bacilli bacterium]